VSVRRGPVRRKGAGFLIDLGDDESALIRRLTGELRSMLTDPDPGEEAMALTGRLFPIAYPHDDEMEAEYQRLMREELVTSKLAAFDVLDAALSGGGLIDEARLVAVMQSINSIRLVLGAMLDVSDDSDEHEVAPRFDDSPEYALYGYLSWLLERCVTVLTGR
jgi:Domain of unknown function (DUF2017)